MKRTYINELEKNIGETVTIKGWINVRRDQGKLVFFEFRDMTGMVQGVVLPNKDELKEKIKPVRSEWVVEVIGKVNQRPERNVQADKQNGSIELEVEDVIVLAEAKTPPFPLDSDGHDIDEEVRLKYRYLDLRRPRLQKNIRIRSEFVDKVRQFLFNKGFKEIETPYFTSTTPEGSRDFVVPSRLYPGKFFALPQSPQQYKQLLMVAGFEKYFQIARCFRDEDLRADRGFEHTQIDIEMSFVTRDELMEIDEMLMTTVAESMGYTIKEKPFPRLSYKEAMEKYGADKFDMRTEDEKEKGILAFAWVIDFPFFEKDKDGHWTFTHNPFSMPNPEHIDWLLKGENIDQIMTQQYDLVCNGFETWVKTFPTDIDTRERELTGRSVGVKRDTCFDTLR